MALTSIAINGTPIEELGLILTQGQPSVSGLNRVRDFLALPGRAGGVHAPVSTIGERVLRFELGTSLRLTMAERGALLDTLRDLFEGLVEVTFVHSSMRRIRGMCRVFEGTVSSPSFLNASATLVVEVACANAAFMDTEPTHLVLSTTPARVSVGTVGHDGRLYVTGPNTTALTITYRSMAGVQWGQLAITPNLATGERMILDLASQQIVKVDSGDARTLQPTWDTGSTWFHILPRDANRELGVMPTLEASVSTLYEYRRNWEH